MLLSFRFALGYLIVAGQFANVSSLRAQAIPAEYQRLFAQRADNRSKFEKALNLIGKTGFPVGRSFALIAGVTQYPNLPEPEPGKFLRPAAVDIEKLTAYLKEQEFFDEIVVLKDGDMTLQNLNYFLENYFAERAKSPHSRFLFAYSGHGYSTTEKGITRGYLLTKEATSLTDPVNRLDLSLVRTMLGPVIDFAEKTLVLINSCESGAFLERGAPFGPNPLGPGEQGAYAIMASRSRERSFHSDAVGPGSVFFEKILAGLGGPADKSPADGVVTYHELDTYLHQEIPYATDGDQNPREDDISRHGSVGEFFFLNRSRQISFGNAPPWNPKDAVAFGLSAEDVAWRAREAFAAKQYSEAVTLFTQAAGAGNVEAMVSLGDLFRNGQGVTQDYGQARQWYEKAASAGSSEAMENLGALFRYKPGLPTDYEQARKWFEKAAAAGNASAMTDLGYMFDLGTGVTQDYGQARKWYERAAALGDALAMDYLAILYDDGRGLPRDDQQARKWFEKAAEAGETRAMHILATKFEIGDDLEQARHWYEKAAEAGSTEDMYELAQLCEQGRGGSQDYRLARLWYEKAAAAGDQRAKERLKVLPD